MRALTAVVLLLLVSAPAAAQDVGRFPIVAHVARDASGAPVVSDEAIRERIAYAESLFRPAGVGFYLEEARALEGESVLTTIRQRRALAHRAVPHRINVFFVETIEDPHPSASTRRAAARLGRELSGRLGGAHIEVRSLVPSTYILALARGDRTSLAHELGHFFGAPHSGDPDNIMSYGHERSAFDPHQLATFRHFARRHRRERTVTAVHPFD